MHRALLHRPLGHSSRHGFARSIGVSMSRCSMPLRTFMSMPRLRTENAVDSISSQDSSAEVKDKSAADAPKISQHTPWYLQEEAAASEQPILSRDQIPELPENPPAILPVLLDYTFKDLGLDGLKLFDLRHLETPSALGANVIMIIGTARSVKHLNVAADRLCRWLRSTYKLTPYADGLLGRNELKIKLRRKAKRARIASQAGAMIDEKDDGITTGWICVNAGVVEKSPVQEELKNRGFEGFGQTIGGTRVVVQIFTEEKRAEVDLEGLWEGNLRRAERKRQKYAEATSDAPSIEVRFPATVDSSLSDRGLRHFPSIPVSPSIQQIRELHSCRRTQSINSVEAADTLPGHSSPISADQLALKSGTSTEALFHYLSGLTPEKARYELGNGPGDRDSTLFLRLFYDRPADFSAQQVALAEVQLMCMAVSLQHPGYAKERLFKSFIDYTCSAYPLSDELGFAIVSALLTERLVAGNEEPSNPLPDADKELALRVLEHLSMRGTNVLNMNVFNMIFKASGHAKGEDFSRVSQVVEALELPFDPDQARDLMVTLFKTQNYDGFWKLWRKLPLVGSPRTSADYERLFQLHADLGHEHRARDCILTWAPMMSREEPPVPIEGPVVQHIMFCLLLADPDIQQRAAKGKKNHLTQLWNKCRTRLT